ncbi:MAG: SoxR reducing system RseC family protein [Magnetococcales bacterium]|nr:SoxR reducing system RseC family protein [Magnetococcales bacterium]
MREHALVMGLEGNQALVVGKKKSGCGSCHAEAGCTTLSMGGGNREVHVRAENRIGAKVGDMVVIELSDSQFLRSSFLVYIVPILVLFFFGFLFQNLGRAWGLSSDAAEGLGGAVGASSLLLVFFWLKWRNRQMERTGLGLPIITEVVSGCPEEASQSGPEQI